MIFDDASIAQPPRRFKPLWIGGFNLCRKNINQWKWNRRDVEKQIFLPACKPLQLLSSCLTPNPFRAAWMVLYPPSRKRHLSFKTARFAPFYCAFFLSLKSSSWQKPRSGATSPPSYSIEFYWFCAIINQEIGCNSRGRKKMEKLRLYLDNYWNYSMRSRRIS